MSIRNIFNHIVKSKYVDSDSLRFSLNLSRDTKVVCHSSAGSVFLRILEKERATSEFKTLSYINSVLPNNSIPVLDILHSGSMSVIVSPFVPFSNVDLTSFQSFNFVEQVSNILAVIGTLFEVNDLDRTFLIVDVRDYFAGNCADRDLVKIYVDNIVPNTLGCYLDVRQHGDFTFTNLGVNANSAVIVFDWEDYGCISFPGFDLATFVLSLLYHGGYGDNLSSPEKFKNFLLDTFGSNLFRSLQIPPSAFVLLFPFYLITFSFLKDIRGYGEEIKKRAWSVFSMIISIPEWKTCLMSPVKGAHCE